MVLCALEIRQVSDKDKICLFHHPLRGNYGVKAIKNYAKWIMCVVLTNLNIKTTKIITIDVPTTDDVWLGSSYHVIAHRFRHKGIVKRISTYNSNRMIKHLLENKFSFSSIIGPKSIESTPEDHFLNVTKFVRPSMRDVDYLFVEFDDLLRYILTNPNIFILNDYAHGILINNGNM